MIDTEVIASFVLKVPEKKSQEVAASLKFVESAELHAYEDNKMIITIIAPDDNGLYKGYNQVKQIEGVLSIELVFCGFTKDGPSGDMVSGTMPEWLNKDVDASEIKYNGRIPKYFS